MKPKSKILIVDDHPLFREGLVRVLSREPDLEVCGEASDGTEALQRMNQGKPDLVLLDISLDGDDGIDLAHRLRERRPDVHLLILSMHDEEVYADRALRAGANGYLTKQESVESLVQAVREVLSGRAHFSPEVSERALLSLSRTGGSTTASSVEGLSDREFEIFRLIGEGYGTRSIADRLHLSIKTVETHREHIRAKMGLSSTEGLVRRAIHSVQHGRTSF
jgi:DNA-binding NarL/FixJ family response regulator